MIYTNKNVPKYLKSKQCVGAEQHHKTSVDFGLAGSSRHSTRTVKWSDYAMV